MAAQKGRRLCFEKIAECSVSGMKQFCLLLLWGKILTFED
jgi:hypothetical protein